LFRSGETVVNIPAYAQVEVPVAGLDLVFNVEGEFLNVGVAEEQVIAAAAGQVVRRKDRKIVAIRERCDAIAVGLTCVPRQRVAIIVHAWSAERIGGIDDTEAVVLAQECLFVDGAGLDVVMSLHIGEVGVGSGVGERAVLRNGRGLQCDWA